MRIFLALILVVFNHSFVAAQHLPAVQFYLNTAYLCGGVGSDESAAFKSARTLYPLSLNFGQQQGPKVAFVADVQVVIRDHQNQTILNINSDGPFCLLDIDYGDYQVYVTYEGQTLQQSIKLNKQGQQLHFTWPE